MTSPLPMSEDTALLSLVEQHVLEQITEGLGQFWLPPHEMKKRMDECIAYYIEEHVLHTVISGETKNIALYVIGETRVLVITPFSEVHENLLLRELYDDALLPRNTIWSIFPKDGLLLQRLSLPRVLLINPCVIEHFPVPRLCLSIGSLASYLRKYQKAEVHVIDMQIGISIHEILAYLTALQPVLVGISISYGQKYLALSLLKEIYRAKTGGMVSSRVVVGNIIPASFPKEFIETYQDILIASGEGELTILKLIDYLTGTCKLSDVPGLVYMDESRSLCMTRPQSVPTSSLALPALDTVEDLARWRGALTLELSRGCQWNVCTFCPREHKSSHWKTCTTTQVIEQFRDLRAVCDRFGLAKHIFLADEEFVGGMNDGAETERIVEIAQTLITEQLHMSFDAAARVDQIYDPKLDKLWHLDRMRMWHLCRQAGLDRLFMGIESGSSAQLHRYGKGIQVEDSVLAIRILSALGIPLRFGFITFDQLMIGLKDLKDNIAFLERTDAFLEEIDISQYGYEQLFDLLLHDTAFVQAHSVKKPIYEGISYMLATMEVLIHSRYALLLQHAERRYNKTLILDKERPDSNMGRYQVTFVDDLIGDVSMACQKWIDRHFGLAYTIKSLYKVAPSQEKSHLMHWMVTYRRISFLLLKSLVWLFDEECSDRYDMKQIITPFPQNTTLLEHLESLSLDPRRKERASRASLVEEVMNLFDTFMAVENTRIETYVRAGSITDATGGQLAQVLTVWKAHQGHWALINGYSN
jgi:B12 binding domain/Radical SAM superfamily